jgi:hypothetical protein
VQRQCSLDYLEFDPRYGGGADVFAALERQVARRDPSYLD